MAYIHRAPFTSRIYAVRLLRLWTLSQRGLFATRAVVVEMFANSGDRNLGRDVVENLVADYTLHILLRGMLPRLMSESDFLTHRVQFCGIIRRVSRDGVCTSCSKVPEHVFSDRV